MRGILADVRHAFRIYRRTPVASGLAVVVLAVAMAFVTAFLSMYVDIGLRGHTGFEDSGRLVTLGQTDGRRFTGFTAAFMPRLSDEIRSLDAVAGFISTTIPTTEPVEQPVVMEIVTADYFAGLQPRLHSGRGFERTDHDPDAAKVVVISYAYWRDVLDGADVLGTSIEINLRPIISTGNANANASAEEEEEEDFIFQVVGIMAPEMTGTMANRTGIWFPFERVIGLMIAGSGDASQLLTQLTLQTVGRLSAGASTESVVQEIRARYAEAPPELRMQSGFRLDAVRGVVSDLNGYRSTLQQLRLFLGASVLLALVAAANVSLFLLARAPGRRRELGIRMAVGAPLGRLARQLASEAALLVVVAASLGLLLSIWLGAMLRGLAFLRQAAWRDVSLLDWRVLALVGSFLLLLTVLVALAPILGLKRLGIAASSRQVAARASLAQRFAGSLQIAIAGTLGGAAIAFGWFLASMTLGYPGYEFRDRYIVQFSPQFNNSTQFQEVMERAMVESARHREALAAIPGISAVAFGSPIPGSNSRSTMQVPDPADPSARLQIRMGTIDSRYVDVLGLRLLHGRVPEDGESEAVLVNEAYARKFFGRTDVVGEAALAMTGPGRAGPQIIGVLEDLSFEHPNAEVEPILFRTSTGSTNMTAIVATSLTAAALQQEVERIAAGGSIEMRVNPVRSLEQLRDTALAPDRARSWLTIGAAVLVVLLAAFGFYGTQRYLVTAGRREYAIRASIGAGPTALGRLVLLRGLILGLPGLVLGAMLAFITVAWLRDGFVSRDVSPFAVALAVVAGLVLLLAAASFGPARQAMRTQPAPLLREE